MQKKLNKSFEGFKQIINKTGKSIKEVDIVVKIKNLGNDVMQGSKIILERSGEISVGLGLSEASGVAIVNGIGFTSAGITSGSTAASMMSSAAIASGGAIKAGSLVAVMQSLGTSLAYTQPQILVTSGATILGVKYIYGKLQQRKIKPRL